MQKIYTQDLTFGRFETWNNQPENKAHHITQVHGVEIVSVQNLPAQGDGIYSLWDNLTQAIAIKTADCLPIIIEGEKGVVFIHAGWRGLADGILKRPEVLSIRPQRALIGPSIHVCCFEVTEEFRENFKESLFFKESNHKLFFNLQLEAKKQLREIDHNLLIEIAPQCTCCHHEFNSYRRDKTKIRNWNLYIKG